MSVSTVVVLSCLLALLVIVRVATRLHAQSTQAETSIDLSAKGCSIRFKTKK